MNAAEQWVRLYIRRNPEEKPGQVAEAAARAGRRLHRGAQQHRHEVDRIWRQVHRQMEEQQAPLTGRVRFAQPQPERRTQPQRQGGAMDRDDTGRGSRENEADAAAAAVMATVAAALKAEGSPPAEEEEKPEAPGFPLPSIGPQELQAGRERGRNGTGSAVRKRWLDRLLDTRPETISREAQAAMRYVFGMGLDATYVNEVCRLAHQLQEAQGAPAQPSAQVPAAPNPSSPAAAQAPAAEVTPAPAEAAPAARQAPAARPPPLPPTPAPGEGSGPEEELRALARALRALCERHGLAHASLTWNGATVKADLRRVVVSSVEV